MSHTLPRASALGSTGILVSWVATCFLFSSCDNSVVTWSAEARSPDGHFLATAETRSWSGPGNAYDATTVYLTQTGQSREAVLGFSHQAQTMKLKMAWLSPMHLDVAYGPSDTPGDRVSVDLQTVRFADVDISLRRLAKRLSGSEVNQ